MKKMIFKTLLVLSILGNIAIGVHAQLLANELTEAYQSLVEWNKYYDTMPKNITYYEDGSVSARR